MNAQRAQIVFDNNNNAITTVNSQEVIISVINVDSPGLITQSNIENYTYDSYDFLLQNYNNRITIKAYIERDINGVYYLVECGECIDCERKIKNIIAEISGNGSERKYFIKRNNIIPYNGIIQKNDGSRSQIIYLLLVNPFDTSYLCFQESGKQNCISDAWPCLSFEVTPSGITQEKKDFPPGVNVFIDDKNFLTIQVLNIGQMSLYPTSVKINQAGNFVLFCKEQHILNGNLQGPFQIIMLHNNSKKKPYHYMVALFITNYGSIKGDIYKIDGACYTFVSDSEGVGTIKFANVDYYFKLEGGKKVKSNKSIRSKGKSRKSKSRKSKSIKSKSRSKNLVNKRMNSKSKKLKCKKYKK